MDIGKIIEIGERKVETPRIAPAKAPAKPVAAPKREKEKA